MDLLAQYSDSDEDTSSSSKPGVVKAAQAASSSDSKSTPSSISRALVCSAPLVNVDTASSAAIQPYLGASQKIVYHNPSADYMWAPVQGPQSSSRSALDGMTKNTLIGYVEKHELDSFLFDSQYHNFHSFGYAANPSMLTGASVAANEAAYVGKADALQNMQGSSHDFSTKAAQRQAHDGLRKRKAGGDASDPSSYSGPWAPYEFEDIEAAAFAKAKEEREARKAEKKEDEEEDDGKGGKRPKGSGAAATERTLFHGESVLDYQGRTYMAPPADMHPEDHACYIPEQHVLTWSGHTKGVNAIRFFPKYGHLLLSASLDSTIKIWDVHNKRKCLRSYLGHDGAVRDVQFSHDGRTFLSASFDKFIKLWDTETGKCLARWTTGKVPYCVQWHGDPDKQSEFLSGMANKKILQWDARVNAGAGVDSGVDTSQPVLEYDEHLGPVNAILFVDDNRRFVSSSDDKKLLFWDYGIPVVIKHMSEPWMHSAPSLTLHPNKKWFCAQSMDNSIMTYGAKDKYVLNRKKRFTGHYNAGYAIQVNFSPDGHFVMSGDGEGRMFFWDWKSGKILRKFKAHDQVTIGSAWHPIEPRLLATCSWDGTIKLWQ